MTNLIVPQHPEFKNLKKKGNKKLAKYTAKASLNLWSLKSKIDHNERIILV
jgi:hypothetical protein